MNFIQTLLKCFELLLIIEMVYHPILYVKRQNVHLLNIFLENMAFFKTVCRAGTKTAEKYKFKHKF